MIDRNMRSDSDRGTRTLRAGVGQARTSLFDTLEPRMLLSGDHPGLADFPNATQLTFDGNGVAFAEGEITDLGGGTLDPGDMFRFTAPATDFVRLLADAQNRAGTLDTRLELYDDTGTLLQSSSGNGSLTAGTPTDAWLGFVAQAGTEYFVRVLGDSQDLADPTATGQYVLRAWTGSTQLLVDTETGIVSDVIPPAPDLPQPVTGAIGLDDPSTLVPGDEFSQDEVFFVFTTPNDPAFNSLATITADSPNPMVPQLTDPTDLDVRFEVYASDGTLVTANSQAGFLSAAAGTFIAEPGETYYIRVRSDEFGDPGAVPSAGAFRLDVDVRADEVDIPNISRTAVFVDGFEQTNDYRAFRFTTEGSGLTFITAIDTELVGLPHDMRITLLDRNGQVLEFVDDFSGTDAEIQIDLEPGVEYYLLVDGFDDPHADTNPLDDGNTVDEFTIVIEANHTDTISFDTAIDDHVNVPTGGTFAEQLARFQLATVMRLNDGQILTDSFTNPVVDRNLTLTSVNNGRLFGPGDSDLFQFTLPVDMLSQYAGDNDDEGTAVFVGGAFSGADTGRFVPVNSRAITIWDGGGYHFVGPQNEVEVGAPPVTVRLGLNDNPGTADTDGPVVHVMEQVVIGGQPFLAVGGDFIHTALDPFGNVIETPNFLLWGYNPLAGRYEWVTALGGTDGPVYAIAEYDPEPYDPDGSGPAAIPDDPGGPFLVIGGDFTDVGGTPANGLAAFDLVMGGWAAIGGLQAGAVVHALELFDPADPGDGRDAQPDATPPLSFVADPPDVTQVLVVGGDFTANVDVLLGAPAVVTNIAMFDGLSLKSLSVQAPGLAASINGPVFALEAWDRPIEDPDNPDEFVLEPRLAIGGDFTQFSINGAATNAPGLIDFGAVDLDQDSQLPAYTPRLLFSVIDAGINTGPIYALHAIIPPLPYENPNDTDEDSRLPTLVIGGDFEQPAVNAAGEPTLAQRIAYLPATGTITAFDFGFDAAVRTLEVLEGDADEAGALPLVSNTTGTVEFDASRATLHIGGEFTGTVSGLPFVAELDLKFSPLAGFFYALDPMTRGGDPIGPDAPVFALKQFDDQNPTGEGFPLWAGDNSENFWDRYDRPGPRPSIVVSGLSDSFSTYTIRVYDSNLSVIYTNNTIAPPFPDPPGAVDPAAAPGFNPAFVLPPMWGGETYYIEVIGDNPTSPTATGRYTLTLTMDALPDDTDGDGVLPGVQGTYTEPADPEFNDPANFANNVPLALTDSSGDIENFGGIATLASNGLFIAGNEGRNYGIKPSGGTLFEQSDFGLINTVNDQDVYSFVAANSGTTEVRVKTRGIGLTSPGVDPDDFPGDQFYEVLAGALLSAQSKIYNSNLDAAIRVFNNDFEQIAYVNDNLIVNGLTDQHSIGTLGPGTRALSTFTNLDPRVIFNTDAGERYFIVIESGQRWSNPADPVFANRIANTPEQIDWRRAIGSYELLIDSMPSAAALRDGDDHAVENQLATPFPIGADGNGISGLLTIDPNTPTNPNDDFVVDGEIDIAADSDTFRFTAVADGPMTITVSRALQSLSFLPSVSIGTNATPFTGGVVLVTSGTAASNGIITLEVDAQKGQEFFINVAGAAGTTGFYNIDISGNGVADDYADEHERWAAQPIQLFDFLGRGEINGEIEEAGDTDLFSFRPPAITDFTITVTPEAGFDTEVLVYEQVEDAEGNVLLRLIGQNNNTSATNIGSTVTVPVNIDRVSEITSLDLGDYFIVVRGANSELSQGTYTLSLDFPPSDDHADVDEYNDPTLRNLATLAQITASTGEGSDQGVLEVDTDTDLFTFIAPAGGPAIIDVAANSDATLVPTVTVFDAAGNQVAQATNSPVSFDAARSQQYFVLVSGGGGTGGYDLAISAPALDDFPNRTEFGIAAPLSVDPATGDAILGSGLVGGFNPALNPTRDTDLFSYTTLDEGNVTVTVTPVGDGLTMRPRLTVFDSAQNVIATTQTFAFQTAVTLDLGVRPDNDRLFILVEDALGAALGGGLYQLAVDGPPGDAGGGDDPAVIDFQTALPIALNGVGDGSRTDLIELAGDRDVFRFTAPASGLTFVQIVTPAGSPLNATITILNQPNENPGSIVVQDDTGLPGVSADVQFNAVGGTVYYAVVDGIASGTGSYTIRVDAVPELIPTGLPDIDARGFNYRLFYPEGFANANSTSEFISIANPNDFDVRYSLILRYETGDRDAVIQDNILLPAGSRGGATLSRDGVLAAGVRPNTPYSVEIVSSGPLGATLARYDFDASSGDSFTSESSNTWSFARVERSPGQVRDFIVYYNPNPFRVNVTMTAFQNGQQVSITQVVEARRRGGFNINALSQLPTGLMGVTLTAQPANSANNNLFEGIAASLSHFDLADSSSYASLGSAGGGASVGVTPLLTNSSSSLPELVLFNPDSVAATVDLRADYINPGFSDLTRRISIAPGSVVRLVGNELGLIANQEAGIEYTSDRPIVAFSSVDQRGESNGSTLQSNAGRAFFFGDAFINRNRAGQTYFETLSFYNPDNSAIEVSVELLYVNGLSDTITIDVDGRGFGKIDLHTNSVFLNSPNATNAFSISVTSDSLFTTNFVHYDLFFGGGWGANGASLGLLTPIDRILA